MVDVRGLGEAGTELRSGAIVPASGDDGESVFLVVIQDARNGRDNLEVMLLRPFKVGQSSSMHSATEGGSRGCQERWLCDWSHDKFPLPCTMFTSWRGPLFRYDVPSSQQAISNSNSNAIHPSFSLDIQTQLETIENQTQK